MFILLSPDSVRCYLILEDPHNFFVISASNHELALRKAAEKIIMEKPRKKVSVYKNFGSKPFGVMYLSVFSELLNLSAVNFCRPVNHRPMIMQRQKKARPLIFNNFAMFKKSKMNLQYNR